MPGGCGCSVIHLRVQRSLGSMYKALLSLRWMEEEKDEVERTNERENVDCYDLAQTNGERRYNYFMLH